MRRWHMKPATQRITRSIGSRLSALILVAAAFQYVPQATAQSLGAFTATASMSVSRGDTTATVLPNGKVLIAGGSNDFTSNIVSAELYDPASGTFSPTGNMPRGHAAHT